MPDIDKIEASNREYAASQFNPNVIKPPVQKAVIVTCMDTRIDPIKLMGFTDGDAHILRNAGGRVTDDTIRSLIISQQFLGTRNVLIIHHTDCGLLGGTNQSIYKKLRDEAGLDVTHIDFRAFEDLDDSVRVDVELVASNPFLSPDTEVAGFVFDVDTGKLRHVAQITATA